MNHRLFAAVALSLLTIATAMPGAVAGRSPESDGVRRLDRQTLNRLRSARDLGPASLKARRPVTVLVELEGDSVAALQGEALARDPSRPLSHPERDAIRDRLAARQRDLRPHILALGGRIVGTYQHALNGIKVRIGPGRLARLAALPGVRRVHHVPVVERGLVHAAQFVKAPQAWTATGRTGDGVTIAVIDTGIDYTHATFGGTGDPAHYDADDGLSRSTGHAFPTSRVVEGIDLAGDAYDAGDPDHEVPVPDDDPLDCAVSRGGDGHGSHVAGIAAGSGVKRVGGVESAYTGPYNSTGFGATKFVVGPGIAPEADLVAIRIFGCAGGSTLVIDGIDEAVAMDVDVINMSLGDYFARADDIISIAVDAASDAGIVVVGSAGNDGPSAYIHGGVATASKAIAVGALNAVPTFPRAIVKPADRTGHTGRNVNGSLALPLTATLHVVPHASGMSEGCSAADYAGFPAGRIAVVMRGDCTLDEKGATAQDAGAVGIVVINNVSSGLPPYLGPAAPYFDIPMVGLRLSSRSAMIAAHGISTKLKTTTPSANGDYLFPADFTSSGPRNGDSALKPDMSAPGVDVVSAGAGSGTGAIMYSGTSMASPVVAGAAALVLEHRPAWLPADVKGVLVGTAAAGAARFAPGQYDILLSGAGSLNAAKAADAVAYATAADGQPSLSFGYDAIGDGGHQESRTFRIVNESNNAITYSLTSAFNGPSHGAALTLSRTSGTVPAHDARSITATLKLSIKDVAGLPDAIVPVDVSVFGWVFQPVPTVKGVIKVTPTNTGNGRYKLRVPFLSVPRGASNVHVTDAGTYSVAAGVASFNAVIRNTGDTGHRATADLYAWGLSDSNEGYESSDIRAAGVQSFACDDEGFGCETDDRLLGFAVNTWGRWSNMSTEEFEILVDVDGDQAADYAVFATDFGAAFTGVFDGTGIVLTCSLDADGLCEQEGFLDGFFVDPPPNGSTAWLPTVASWLGLDSTAGSFDYTAAAINVFPHEFELVDTVEDGASDVVWAPWNPWHPSVEQGDFYPLGRGASQPHTFRVSLGDMETEGAPLGWMVVAVDDDNGAPQADLVPLGAVPAP